MSMLQHGLSEDSSYTSYTINQSLRFRASNNAYLSRTFGSIGNRKTWTFSTWIKFYISGAYTTLFTTGAAQNSTLTSAVITGTGQLGLYSNSTGIAPALITTALLRDPSAHYHVLFVFDSTKATTADRMQIWINGVRATSFASELQPSLNLDWNININQLHQIGNGISYNTSNLDGYLSEVNFIDGQALDPSYFGQTDPATGIWVPKKYTGTYGNNGFYLPFNDATSLTTLGYDRSGNGNNWTCNGISITAGATYDVMKDSPTNGLNEVGNYATWNPLNQYSTTVSNGNLSATSATNGSITSTILTPTSGKWYAEIVAAGSYSDIGIVATNTGFPGLLSGVPVGYLSNSYGYYYNGNKIIGGAQTAYGAAYTTNDIIGIAIDADAGTVTMYKNNVSQGVIASGLTGYEIAIAASSASGSLTHIANFGQRPFAYTPPTGFKALHTGNLADATPVTTSGTFTGNASADGPCIFINGTPTAMTINGNAVTFATHADKLAGGFKIRSSSASYNASGSNTYSITTNSGKFKYARAQGNP